MHIHYLFIVKSLTINLNKSKKWDILRFFNYQSQSIIPSQGNKLINKSFFSINLLIICKYFLVNLSLLPESNQIQRSFKHLFVQFALVPFSILHSILVYRCLWMETQSYFMFEEILKWFSILPHGVSTTLSLASKWFKLFFFF